MRALIATLHKLGTLSMIKRDLSLTSNRMDNQFMSGDTFDQVIHDGSRVIHILKREKERITKVIIKLEYNTLTNNHNNDNENNVLCQYFDLSFEFYNSTFNYTDKNDYNVELKHNSSDSVSQHTLNTQDTQLGPVNLQLLEKKQNNENN